MERQVQDGDEGKREERSRASGNTSILRGRDPRVSQPNGRQEANGRAERQSINGAPNHGWEGKARLFFFRWFRRGCNHGQAETGQPRMGWDGLLGGSGP